ncbi:hypothetical protein VNO77_03579 [Canavalia gladiata]|uniref:Uncharacterized protein n=1 Tax=Canavalia gladiata TaxID=3824 RepID=A0AAN9MWZ1_CANGL
MGSARGRLANMVSARDRLANFKSFGKFMDIAMRGSSSLVPSPSSVPTLATGLVRRFQPCPSRHGPYFRFQSLPVPAHACFAKHRPELSNSAHHASSPLFCIAAASIARWPGQTRSSRHRPPLRRVVPGLRP